MSFSRGHRSRRAALQMEHLEDRVTPAGFDPRVPLADQAATGVIAPDRVIVTLNAGTNSAVLGTNPTFVREVKALGFNVYSVRLTPGTDLGTALAYYGGRGGVTAAEPDEILHGSRTPNDSSYNLQYGPAKIGAEKAWNITTGNPNFVIGVIDTGIDANHPDLAANIWTNPGEIPGDGIDNDGNGYIDDVQGWDFANDDNDPFDDNGHGTHVSGILGARGDNGVGVAGVNWNIKIMPLKFLGANNSGRLSDAIAAINYSVTMGVKLTNNSWGGGGLTQAMGRAISGAETAGQIFVAAAGNSSLNNDIADLSPTNYANVLTNVVSVAATDSNDQLAGFSDFGARTVTLAAPGVQIYSAAPGGGYQYLSGTSMATPQVAGAIALYWGANPTLTYDQVINKLKSSVDKIPALAGKVSTGGRLNVARMFDAVVVPPVVVGAAAGTEVVRVLAPGGATQRAFDPHPGFLGGVVAAAGDVSGDGVPDVVTAATFGGHVKVFDGATGAETRSFYAFEGYRGPINLAIGDLTGDGVGDIIVAANLNGHVKVFDGLTGQLVFSDRVYQGYAGAIAVSVADMDGDGRNDLVTAADAGFGVHVKSFRAGTTALNDSFLASPPGSWPDFSMTAADLDLDGVAELLVSQGPRVRVLDARTKAVRADFLAFDPLTNARVTVQAGRYTGDQSAELVAIAETGGRSHVKVFDGPNFVQADSFFAGTR